MATKKRKASSRKTKVTRKKATTRRSTTKRAKTTRRATTKRVSSTRSKMTSRKTKTMTNKRKSMETGAIRDTYNKSQIMNYLADCSELSKKQVSEMFDALGNLMERHLKKGAAGEFTLPGLMKCKVKRKPATKARKGVNPFTGEPTVFKAKPARNVVKVRPLKKLKEMVE